MCRGKKKLLKGELMQVDTQCGQVTEFVFLHIKMVLAKRQQKYIIKNHAWHQNTAVHNL